MQRCRADKANEPIHMLPHGEVEACTVSQRILIFDLIFFFSDPGRVPVCHDDENEGRRIF